MIDKRDLDAIQSLIQKDDPVLLVSTAERLGLNLAKDKLTNSQFRNIYGQIRQIVASWRIEDQRETARRNLMLVKPRIHYQAAKDGKDGVRNLRDILDKSIDTIFHGEPDADVLDMRFRRFADFFEAVLAYHRANDGK